MFNKNCLFYFSILFIGGLAINALSVEHPIVPELDCTICHSCPTPTTENPCLIKIAPKDVLSSTAPAAEGPDIVILDELEQLYVPVRFNHELHAKMADMDRGCQTCHHYQDISKQISSCKSCHPKEIIHENLAQPGLKGAYHRQCLGCHTQWDQESKCEVCHEKKAGGQLHGTAETFAIHVKHQPIVMKELITFKTEFDENDLVPFHHKRHAEKYERNCSVCHKEQSCEACHVHRQDSHPMGNLTDIDLHDVCFQCHEEDGCEHCHGQDPEYVFDHESTGWPLKPYHAELYCRNCHAQRGPYMALNNDCTNCHKDGWDVEEFSHSITGVELDEMHQMIDCTECHTEGISKPATCTNCHDDERVYSKETGFGGESE